MKSAFTGETMIFRKDYEGRQLYSTTIGKKKQDGTYENGYIDVQFKKGVNLADKTKIEVINGWLTFYLNKDKKPVWQIFINEFEQLSHIPSGFKPEDESQVPDGFYRDDRPGFDELGDDVPF